ncbi:MAG TPA: peptidoglycan-binding protein [Acetobacteraceae bacterium]|nr:peptidoglycan-binding protein [Acetobacteraceae bacterium]
MSRPHGPSRVHHVLLLWLPVLACTASAAFAAPDTPPPATPAGVGLVIGNATYPGLPSLPACLTSAHAVSAALRRLHFDVVEQEDASEGYMDGALAQFSQQVRQADHPPTVIYVCGYASAFNGRPFLLPVSANVTRPADLLTQAVLARSVVSAGVQANAGPSLSVVDVAPMPGAPADLGLTSLAQGGLPPRLGVAVATDQAKGVLPTPVANALVTALGGALPVTVDGVLAAVQHASGAQIAAAQMPAEPGALAAAPIAAATSVPVKPAPPAPASAPPPSGATPGPAATTAPAVSPAPAAASMPAEDQMTEANRRDVQIALARLGYYDGRIDGVFGPDTRAAIRRWQHEVHTTMTGQLTAAEASRLVAQ